MIEKAEAEKIRIQTESQLRKDRLAKAQIDQNLKMGKLGKVEDDANAKNNYLLQRAQKLRQEQEEEIKEMNSAILACKCMVIREAQVKEKIKIKEEWEAEEKRLDAMVEQERQRAIKADEEKHEKEAAEMKKFVNQINQQLKENYLQKLVEAEKLEEESRLINKAVIAMQKEDAEKLRQKELAQKKAQAELVVANENLEVFKKVRIEEERIQEMRLQEFLRKKREREDAREAELAALKAAKEKEIARMMASQQGAMELQAAQDELNARRIQEETEKKWREEAKAAIEKKKAKDQELVEGRRKQIDEIRRAQALELERDEQEFHEVAKVQQKLYEIERDSKASKHMAAVKHRKELLKQINEKERERICMHQLKFKEGEALRLEQDLRSLKLKETMNEKIEYLKEHKVPHKYISDLQRQFKLP
ncbi:cilia- and flagella-associated protein 45-like isoform X2 [Onthophagus taurus]|nr:cilia- and flagella-associated protein 45-like isoform X2 [Onthophagus taurus]